MKKGWRFVLTLVLILVLLGAVAVGVGFLTGSSLEKAYNGLVGSPVFTFINTMIGYWNQFIDSWNTWLPV